MNPVVDILQKILAKNRKDIVTSEWLNGKGGVAAFSYKESFEALWGIEPDGKGLLDIASCLCQNVKDPMTLAILWDGIPGGNTGAVNTARYLTPIDWAVALSLAIKRAAEKSQKLPKIRIAILDTGSRLVPGADAIHLLPYLSLDMPWIRFFQQDGKEEKWYQAFVKEVRSESEPAHFMNNAGTSVEVIERIWKTALTKTSIPGDQHAIANIVGPLLLMEDDVNQDAHAKALRSLMKALGLIPEEAKREAFPWIKWDDAEWSDRLSRLTKNEGKLNLILIDDQYTQGWGKVLCMAVGAEYDQDKVPIWKNEARRLTVKAFDSATGLVERLKELDANNLDQRFRFRIDESDKDEKISEILFLDLRLFSGKSLDDEIKFFKDLIIIARKFLDKKDLPWIGFNKGDIDKVANWCNGNDGKKIEREDDEYIEALTLLPRILALTDLSLPIVIFSSTGRRNIAEKLKDYGNIITDFDKPKFTVDMPEDIAGQTKRKLQEAFKKALLFLQGREKCRGIIQNASSPKPLETEGKGTHVELYIDEDFISARVQLDRLPPDFMDKVPGRLKGQFKYFFCNLELQGWMNENEKKELLKISSDLKFQNAIETLYSQSQNHAVRVGGLFAIYSDETLEKARIKADLFDDVCTNSGILYFDPTPSQNSSAKIKIKKTNSSSIELAEAMKNAHKPVGLFFVRLSFTIPESNPSIIGSPFDPRSGDSLYRFTLSTLIELFLSEILPAMFGQKVKDISVSIFVATKLKPLTGNDLNMATYSTGQVPTENKNFLTTISRDSIHPFVLDTLAYHQIEPKICRAIGITLRYKDSEFTAPQKPKFYICRTCKEQRTIDELTKNQIRPCSCGTTDFKPDYRALHYIADEILGPRGKSITNGNKDGYGATVKVKPWGFDEEIENLETTISASRKLDNKDVVGAIIEIDTKFYGITQLLSGRIATELKTLKGWDFCRIAVGLSDEKPEAINLFRFFRPREPKNSGLTKEDSAPTKPIQGGLEQKAINTPAAQNSSDPINSKKEVIIATSSKKTLAGKKMYICQRDNGEEVLISHNQVIKNPALRNIKIGDKLKVSINEVNGKFYANDIEPV